MHSSPRDLVRICRKIVFSSGHRYFNPLLEESENRKIYGSLYSEHGSGHNFTLEAWVEGRIDERSGMVMNLRDLDRILKEVTDPLDHHFLNLDVPEFQDRVPTAENIARYCFDRIQERLASHTVRLYKVRVYEGDQLWVDYGTGL